MRHGLTHRSPAYLELFSSSVAAGMMMMMMVIGATAIRMDGCID